MATIDELKAQADAAAQHFGVPVNLFEAQIQQESGWNPNATNGNAAGIAQFMPATAVEYGVVDRYDPSQALWGAAAYDAALYKQTGSWQQVVTKYGTVPSSGNLTAGQSNVLETAYSADTGVMQTDPGSPAPPGYAFDKNGNLIDMNNDAALANADQNGGVYFQKPIPGTSTWVDPNGTGAGGLGGPGTVQGGSGLHVVGTQGGYPLSLNTSGSLSTQSQLSGNVGTTVNTANPGGISGLFYQLEEWFSSLFIRGSIVILALILIAVALMMFKPVRETVVAGAKAVA